MNIMNDIKPERSIGRESLLEFCSYDTHLTFLKIQYTLEWIEKAAISINYPKLPKQVEMDDDIYAYLDLRPRVRVTERGFYESHSWLGWDEERTREITSSDLGDAFEKASQLLQDTNLPQPLLELCVKQLEHVALVLEYYPNLGDSLTLSAQLDNKEGHTSIQSSYFRSFDELLALKSFVFGEYDLQVIIDTAVRELPKFYKLALDKTLIADSKKFAISNQSVDDALRYVIQLDSKFTDLYIDLISNSLFPSFDKHTRETRQQRESFAERVAPFLRLIVNILTAQTIYKGQSERNYFRQGYFYEIENITLFADESIRRIYSPLLTFYKIMLEEII